MTESGKILSQMYLCLIDKVTVLELGNLCPSESKLKRKLLRSPTKYKKKNTKGTRRLEEEMYSLAIYHTSQFVYCIVTRTN